MAKINFDYLNIRFQKRYKNKGFIMKENTGLDTETLDGYVKLICDHTGDFKEVKNFDDCLYFLTRTKFRNKYNWFFNIQYDFESIIKHLDEDVLIELYRNKEIQYNDYKLKYIPKKYFVIQSKSNMNYYFYDMYNFLDGSLNTMSLKLLGEGKLVNRPCAKRIGFDNDYWIQEHDRIIQYCIKDADLTKRLADKFWGLIYKNLEFYPKTPMSKGKLSEEYFLHKCNIPAINDMPEKVLKTAYQSYYGGHFEILKRGYFEKVYSYDIKSAYPSIIADLIDYNKGKWEKVVKMDENCHTGFYACKIKALEQNFSPFMQKVGGSQGLNIYPNGSFTQYLTKEEILFFRQHFTNSTINIEYGYEFTPKEEIKPFKS